MLTVHFISKLGLTQLIETKAYNSCIRPVNFREIAPVSRRSTTMAWYYGNQGEPIYVSNGDSRFNQDGIFYHDPAPVSFRTPPFYSDVYYRRSFRDQHPHFRHGGELIPPREQVRIRREDPDPNPTATGPWWHNPDHPHNGCTVWVVDRHHEDDDEDSTLEFYAPQLYSDSCQRRVEDALRECPGVVNVVADQWEKKVVVVGSGLREENVLRRLLMVPRMEHSELWRDRRC